MSRQTPTSVQQKRSSNVAYKAAAAFLLVVTGGLITSAVFCAKAIDPATAADKKAYDASSVTNLEFGYTDLKVMTGVDCALGRRDGYNANSCFLYCPFNPTDEQFEQFKKEIQETTGYILTPDNIAVLQKACAESCGTAIVDLSKLRLGTGVAGAVAIQPNSVLYFTDSAGKFIAGAILSAVGAACSATGAVFAGCREFFASRDDNHDHPCEAGENRPLI